MVRIEEKLVIKAKILFGPRRNWQLRGWKGIKKQIFFQQDFAGCVAAVSLTHRKADIALEVQVDLEKEQSILP